MRLLLMMMLFAVPMLSHTQEIVHLQINDGNVIGSGFTVARIGDTVFVVTAGHVPMDSKQQPPVIAGFIGDQELKGIRVIKVFGRSDTKDDIALLSGVLKGATVFRNSIDPPAIGKDVFFFSGIKKVRMPNDEDGIIERWLDDENDWFEIYLDGVRPGDSGSALFSEKGVIGMVISFSDYYARAISILYIKNKIRMINPAYWQIK